MSRRITDLLSEYAAERRIEEDKPLRMLNVQIQVQPWFASNIHCPDGIYFMKFHDLYIKSLGWELFLWLPAHIDNQGKQNSRHSGYKWAESESCRGDITCK